MKKVIKCGQFFDSNTGKVLKDIAVVIDGNKITEVALLPMYAARTLK